MTGASYQTGKDPAFQFIGDVMGGYENPMQLHAWLNYCGVTSITEAAVVGVVGALLLIALRGELGFAPLNDGMVQTLKACGMFLWVTFGVSVLVRVYNLSGGRAFMHGLILGADLPPLVTIGPVAALRTGRLLSGIGSAAGDHTHPHLQLGLAVHHHAGRRHRHSDGIPGNRPVAARTDRRIRTVKSW